MAKQTPSTVSQLGTAAQVIILGAGLSGLQAAYDLQQAGVTCLVLEARARVGGKLWSVPLGREGLVKVELGGAWTNDVNQPRVMSLVKKFGLEVLEQNISGDCIVEGYGRYAYGADPEASLPEDDKKSLARVRDDFERLCHEVDVVHPEKSLPTYGDMSVDELARSLGATEMVLRIVNIWTSAMLGLPSTDVSAIYFLLFCRSGGGLLRMRSDAKGGGQALRIRQGTQSLCTGLFESLRPGTVVFSAAAVEVDQTAEQGCVVTIRDGRRFYSGRVISTLPTPLLQDVAFYPALSAEKTRLSQVNRLGFYAKVFLVYAKPWWRERGLCGLTQGFSGPVSLTRDTSSDRDGMFALGCFMVGASGEAWAQKPRERRRAEVIAQIDRIYGERCPQPLQVVEQIWNNEEFSKGSPCPVVASSCLQLLGRDHWRPEGRLHFAGTETSDIWKGYMEGALTSGSRAAREVIENLGGNGAVAIAKL